MPIDKSMSLGDIIKKEMKAGKSQEQATAIAYSVKGDDRKGNDLSWRDRLNTLEERAARGTARYASKENEKTDNPKIDIFVDGKYEATTTWAKTCKEAVEKYKAKHGDEGKVTASFQNMKENEDDVEDRQESGTEENDGDENLEGHGLLKKSAKNADEASEEEREIQEDEAERKEEMKIKNSVIVRILNKKIRQQCTVCDKWFTGEEGDSTCPNCKE